MKETKPSDPVESLIEAAHPEMSRMEDSAGIGFETRLHAVLGEQNSAVFLEWESATRRGLRFALGITTIIALQAAFWFGSRIDDGILQTELIVERLLLGI